MELKTESMTVPEIPFDEPDALVPPSALAKFFGTTVGVLAQYRHRGIGVPYVVIGRRRIMYRVRDIRGYLDANTVMKGSAAR